MNSMQTIIHSAAESICLHSQGKSSSETAATLNATAMTIAEVGKLDFDQVRKALLEEMRHTKV